MRNAGLIRLLFVVAGCYDGVLGMAFLLAGPAIFSRFGVQPPGHWGYLQFPALLLLIFALMFFAVALRPTENRGLILYGILLKIGYSGLVVFHWATGGIPGMWKVPAIVDLLFVAAFVWAYRAIGRSRPAAA